MPIYVNYVEVQQNKFSGGELNIKLSHLDQNDIFCIEAKLCNSDDIMTLLLSVDAIRRERLNVKINLTIWYFPYARQDRVCNSGEALGVKVIADLINSLNLDSVFVYDPHSYVLPALLNNCVILSQNDILIKSSIWDKIIADKVGLISPDAGASKKVLSFSKVLAHYGYMPHVIEATKERCPRTGEILKTSINDIIINDSYIIIDDICDGGRTFIEIAKKVKELKNVDLYLYVTYGIFSKGLDELKKYFKNIFAFSLVNSSCNFDDKFLKKV